MNSRVVFALMRYCAELSFGVNSVVMFLSIISGFNVVSAT